MVAVAALVPFFAERTPLVTGLQISAATSSIKRSVLNRSLSLKESTNKALSHFPRSKSSLAGALNARSLTGGARKRSDHRESLEATTTTSLPAHQVQDPKLMQALLKRKQRQLYQIKPSDTPRTKLLKQYSMRRAELLSTMEAEAAMDILDSEFSEQTDRAFHSTDLPLFDFAVDSVLASWSQEQGYDLPSRHQ